MPTILKEYCTRILKLDINGENENIIGAQNTNLISNYYNKVRKSCNPSNKIVKSLLL